MLSMRLVILFVLYIIVATVTCIHNKMTEETTVLSFVLHLSGGRRSQIWVEKVISKFDSPLNMKLFCWLSPWAPSGLPMV